MDINSLSRPYDPELDDVEPQHFVQGGDVTDAGSSGGTVASGTASSGGVPTVTRSTNYFNPAAQTTYPDPSKYVDYFDPTKEEDRVKALQATFNANTRGFGTQQTGIDPMIQQGDAFKDPRNPFVMTMPIDPETGAPRNPNSYYGLDALPGSTAGPGNTHDPRPARAAAAQKMLSDYNASVSSTPYRAPSQPKMPTTADFISRTNKGLPGLGRKQTVEAYQDNPNYMPFEYDENRNFLLSNPNTIRTMADGGAVDENVLNWKDNYESEAEKRYNQGVKVYQDAVAANREALKNPNLLKLSNEDQLAFIRERDRILQAEIQRAQILQGIIPDPAKAAAAPAASSSYVYDQNDPNAVRIAQLTGHAPAPATGGLNIATATALMRKGMTTGLSDADTAPYGGYAAVKKFWQDNGGTEANTLNTGAPPPATGGTAPPATGGTTPPATGGTTPPATGGTTTTPPRATDTLLPPSNPAYPGGGNTLVTQPNVTPPPPPIVSQTDVTNVTGTKAPGTTGTGVSVAPGTNIPFQPLPGTLQTTPAKADLTKFNSAYNNNQNLNSVMGYLPPGFSFDPSKYFQPSQAQNQIKASPNLTPQSLGQYQQTTDRMGNLIAIPTIDPLTFQPFVRTRAEGGLVDDEDDKEASGAKQMMKGYEQLTGPRQTQVTRSPNRQSVRTQQASQIVDQRGRPAGMSMNVSSMTTAQGPSQASPEQLATAKAMLADLMRQNMSRKRFAGGGDVSNFKGGAPVKAGAPAKAEKELEEPGFFDIQDYAAKASTKMFPKQLGQDDQRDAARHMLAAALVSRKLGAGMAEFLGKAHERTSNPMSFFNMIGIGEPRYDYPVDVHNNKLGADLGPRAKNQNELEKMVQDLAKTSVNEQQPGRPWTVAPETVKGIMEKQKKMAETPPEYRADGSPEEGEGYVAPANPFAGKAAKQAEMRAARDERSRVSAAREKVAKTPVLDEAGGETTDEFIQRTMGIDPSVNEQRGTFLPQKIKRNGKSEWIAPSIVTGALLPYNMSTQALTTGRFDEEKVPEAAMNTSLGSLAFGKAPAGSLGMAVKSAGGKWKDPLSVVDPATGETVLSIPSNLTEYINRALERVPGDRNDVRNFIIDKLYPYIKNTFGTDKDPIRAAILEGKVKDEGTSVYSSGVPDFRTYMVNAAREAQNTIARSEAAQPRITELKQAIRDAQDAGQPKAAATAKAQLDELYKTLPSTAAQKKAFEAQAEALQDFHRIYDNKTNITATILTDEEGANLASNALINNARDLMSGRLTATGVKPEHQNIPGYINHKSLEGYAADLFSPKVAGDRGTALAQQLVERVRAGDPQYQTLVDAVRRGEPLYDLVTSSGPQHMEGLKTVDIGKLLSTIPENKLKGMSAAEAFKSAFPQWKLTKDFEQLVENVRYGRAYPKEAVAEILDRGLKPVEVPGTNGWYRVATPQAVQIEGAQMKHSVGGYATQENYNRGGKAAFNAGDTRVYSFRPQKNKPLITLDLYDNPNTGQVNVHSLSGPYNSSPENHIPEVIRFLRSIPNLDPNTLPHSSYRATPTGELLDAAKRINWKEEYQIAERTTQHLLELERQGYMGPVTPEAPAAVPAAVEAANARLAEIRARRAERQAARAQRQEARNQRQEAPAQGIPPPAAAIPDEDMRQIMQGVIQDLRQNDRGDVVGIPAPAPAVPPNGVIGNDGVIRLEGRGNFPIRRPNE